MIHDIQNLDIQKITPLEALNLINAWKETIDGE
jgi:hypothetical protein